MELLTGVRRGAFAGAAGGLLAGVFGLGFAERAMDRAVRLESARERAGEAMRAATGATTTHHADVFGRGTQHLGLLVASLATGLALGVLFGVLFALVHRDKNSPATDGDGWRRSLTLGGAAWFAVFLVPFVRYPANPPGVGNPDTVDVRTRAYLTALVIGLLGVLTAAGLARRLNGARVRASYRQLAVTAVLLATLMMPLALPTDTDALDVPAGLLWQFRLLAFATSTLLWSGLAVTFGLLTEHAAVSPRPRDRPTHRVSRQRPRTDPLGSRVVS